MKLGSWSHGLRTVTEGLTGDEQVVIAGLQMIRPSATVEIERSEIKLGTNEGLPDDYTPVPQEEWLDSKPGEGK